MISTALPRGLWLLSATLMAWLWAPTWTSVLAASVSWALSLWLVDHFRDRKLGWAVLIGFMSLGLARLMLGTSVAALLLGPEAVLLLIPALECAALVIFFVPFFLWATPRMSLLRPVEYALLALPWLLWVAPHRYGQLGRPQALVEPIWGQGIDPSTLFSTIGALLAVALLGLQAVRTNPKREQSLVPHLMVIGLIGWGLLALLPAEHISREIIERDPLRTGGVAQSREHPALPVAVVIFRSDFTPRRGNYYFRLGALERSQEEDPGATPTGGENLAYRVAELTPSPLYLYLGENPRFEGGGRAESERFRRVYTVFSTVYEESLDDLLEQPLPLGSQRESPYLALAQSVVPPEQRQHPLQVALTIKFWLELHRSESETHLETTVDELLLAGKPASQEIVSLGAVELMRALGLNVRLERGFVVRGDQRGHGSTLLLTEGHHRWWPSVWLDGVGWTPIDIHPGRAPLASEQPVDRNLQRELGELARRQTVSSGELTLGARQLWSNLLGAFGLLCLGGYGVKVFRYLRSRWSGHWRSPIWAYIDILDRLAEVGEIRRSGETREAFAQRVSSKIPTFRLLTVLHLRSVLGPQEQLVTAELKDTLRKTERDFERAYPWPRRWLGWLNPFSWIRVS